MVRIAIKIVNRLGLHARTAAKVVKLASNFESDIKLEKGKHIADATSILSLLELGATKNSRLILTVNGTDESNAAREIERLFLDGFDELD